jgi:hypothetical protein
MLFRFILYSVVAWFVFRWLDGFFGPRKGSSKGKAPGPKAGKKSRVKKDVGEYIDYEEVKEDK